MRRDKTLVSITITSRPSPGKRRSASGWHLVWHETTCRIALIHGAGQGPATGNIAATAARAMSAAPRLAPAQTITRCHEALRGTPGASVLVARFDGPERRIALAGAGEIAAKLYRDGECLDLPLNRGTVGGILGRIDAADLEVGSDWLLIARTAGEDEGSAAAWAAAEAHHAVLGLMSLPSAGATVLVARPR